MDPSTLPLVAGQAWQSSNYSGDCFAEFILSEIEGLAMKINIFQPPFDTPSASSSITLGVRSGYSGCLLYVPSIEPNSLHKSRANNEHKRGGSRKAQNVWCVNLKKLLTIHYLLITNLPPGKRPQRLPYPGSESGSQTSWCTPGYWQSGLLFPRDVRWVFQKVH